VTPAVRSGRTAILTTSPMLEFRIARRFIWRNKTQSLLIVLGIAVGIAVQVFVGSLITSLQDSLIETTVGSSSHVTLQPEENGSSFRFGPADAEAVVSDLRVTAVAPVQVISALVPVGETSAPLVLKGGRSEDLDGVYKLSGRMVSGNAALTGSAVLLGKDFVEEYGFQVGDPIDLVLADGSRVESRVQGVFDLGSQAANQQSAFMDIGEASRAVGRGVDEVNVVEIQIDDVFASREFAAELAALYPHQRAVDWQSVNGELLTALQSQSTSSYMIQVFVVIAVMLGIASTLAISAVQKTRQIGILKALGMSDSRTGLVFLYQAGMLGVAGTALGIGASLGMIEVFSLIARAGNSGLFPIEPRPGFVLISAAIGILVALVSAAIPYRKTARLDPIQVIQGA